MNFSHPNHITPDSAQRSATSGPDEQTLLLYLLEPTELSQDQLAAIHDWIASDPEHADQLAMLAEQLYCVTSHVQSLPSLDRSGARDLSPVPLQIAESVAQRVNWGWLVSIAATALLAAWWFSGAGQRSTDWSDEVALNWAANHETLAAIELEPWTVEESTLISDPTITVGNDAALDVTAEHSEQGTFGFSDGEPPEWLLAAFIDSDETVGLENDSAERKIE